MSDCMPCCAASLDISPMCTEGSTSVADSPVSPCNVASMNGSSVVGISRLRKEGNEWSHTMESMSVSGISRLHRMSDSTLERKGGVWLHIYATEKTCQSNLLHSMRHERYIVG
jgi:hypothetical protein